MKKSEIAIRNNIAHPKKYVPQKYWEIKSSLCCSKSNPDTFSLLFKTDDKQYALHLSKNDAQWIMQQLQDFFN